MTVEFSIGAPQAVLLVLYGLSLALNIRDHGKPREPTNAWTALVSMVLQIVILWWGGFFS